MDLRELAAQLAADTTPDQEEENAPAVLRREQDQRDAADRRSLDICREYQENQRIASQSMTFILKGVQAGENPYRLLLSACDCIGRLTSDRNFREQVKARVEDVAGRGLLQPDALEIELEDIRSRLVMLTRPELEGEPGASRRQISAAIRAHQKRAGEIERVLRDQAEVEDRERRVMEERAAKLERMERDPEYRAQVEAAQRGTLGLIS